MNDRRPYFTVHELLIMAALAALGGASGSAVSWIGGMVHSVTGLPGGLQFMAGIHVLWLVLAVGLIRKAGAATMTGLLKGAVELLSASRHGPIVFLLSALAGLCVDVVWVLTGRRNRLATYMLAGGLGAASNLLVFKFVFALPAHRAVNVGLAALTAVAFASGALLAGLLAWSLLNALARAGVVGTREPARASPPGRRIWVGAGIIGGVVLLIGTAIFFSSARRTGEPDKETPTPPTTSGSRTASPRMAP